MSQLRIIDFSDDEINQLLDHLYPALANEIEQLKTLMQGQKDSTITGSMYIREGVGYSHKASLSKLFHTQSTNQTSDTPFKSQPLLLPKTKKGGKNPTKS